MLRPPFCEADPVLADVRIGHKRSVQADGGRYTLSRGGVADDVVVQSEVVGGLFIWAYELQRNGGDVSATLESFTHWLWSGNGFSKERYAKLGLERPRPPDSLLKKVAAEQAAAPKQLGLAAATAHGLESLRAFEGMEMPHAPGAITNPSAYREPAKKSGPGQALPKFAAGFGGANPTRSFTP